MSLVGTKNKIDNSIDDLESAIYRLEEIPKDDCTERTLDCIKNAIYEIELAKKFLSMIDMTQYDKRRNCENIRIRRPRIKRDGNDECKG